MKKILTLICIFYGAVVMSQDFKSFPMWNYNLPFEQRVNDVVNRLTLDEKIAQLMHTTPAIPRLGIPAYNWWNETLHGVARTPFNTTSYPQAIGMAATWDTSSMRLMGYYCAVEGRAVHNKATELHKEGDIYMGLTYWTPNINIFRDPRWGRGQETYGEDPYLTGLLGHAFVKGLQGTNSKYLQAAACAKHFAVHSGPEPSRHSDNFNPSPYDLWDTYLPAFHELIVNADVAGVMCAYNAVNNQPCCANSELMIDILRKQWKFTGYVTSDCWALDDFFRYHKTHPTALASAVDALVHTTDVECGNSVYSTLADAVKQGLIKESDLDVSLKRLFLIRYKLGFFDPPAMVPLGLTPASALEAPEHQAHALKMARQSIVLLKNQNNTLPISKNIKKIAVIGPNADNAITQLANYNGAPSHVITVLEGIKNKVGNNVEVIYEKAINYADDSVMAYNDITELFKVADTKGVRVAFYNNTELEGTPAYTGIVKGIDHYRSEGQPAYNGVSPSNFSARFSTSFLAPQSKEINFEAAIDGNYRIYINDKIMVDNWNRRNIAPEEFSLNVKQGENYKIVIEYHHGEGPSTIKFKSGQKIKTNFNALAQKLRSADAIVFAGGISPQLEGEEMPIAVPGFKGGDRTSIKLPEIQTELLKALKTTGKPVVFVMMTGSALAIPWEDENIPAIINAWYGGQSGGEAVADVLFGDYNPAGRLPITFYRSDSDLPDFSNYDMANRTYRYFKGTPLYPFGYGLSYSQFKYSNLQIPNTVKKGKNITVSAKVTNVGKRDGDEVVQLYISHKNNSFKSPVQALKGFERIFLKAGETKTVRFQLTPDQLSVVNQSGQAFQPKGNVFISVGGGQPNVQNKTSGNVLSGKLIIK